MSQRRTRRARKQRRAIKAVLRYGANARPIHKSRSGRTGKVHSSQLKGRQAAGGQTRKHEEAG
jgi:hypothetical protein